MGDAWYPVVNNPAAPYDSIARFRDGLADMRGHAETAGRDPGEIEAGLLTVAYRLGEADVLEDGMRRPFTGPAQAVLDDIGAFAEAGLDHLVIGFESDDLERSLETIDGLAQNVIAKAG